MIELPEAVAAPVEKGQPVGTVRVLRGGETVQEIPITAAESAEAITFGSAFQYLLSWFSAPRRRARRAKIKLL